MYMICNNNNTEATFFVIYTCVPKKVHVQATLQVSKTQTKKSLFLLYCTSQKGIPAYIYTYIDTCR